MYYAMRASGARWPTIEPPMTDDARLRDAFENAEANILTVGIHATQLVRVGEFADEHQRDAHAGAVEEALRQLLKRLAEIRTIIEGPKE